MRGTKSENGEFLKSEIILSAALQTYEAKRAGGGDVRGMKGAVTAVTQSYIFVPRTVNIHEDKWCFTQMNRDVRGIKDAATTATTTKRFRFSVTVHTHV